MLTSTNAYSAFEYLWGAEGVGFNYGHVYRVDGTLKQDKSSETGYSGENAKLSSVEETNRIPLIKGHGFDVHLLLFKLPPDTKSIDLSISHPPMTLPSGKVFKTISKSISTHNARGFPEISYAYLMDEDYEMVEGDWSLSFSREGTELFRITFTMYK